MIINNFHIFCCLADSYCCLYLFSINFCRLCQVLHRQSILEAQLPKLLHPLGSFGKISEPIFSTYLQLVFQHNSHMGQKPNPHYHRYNICLMLHCRVCMDLSRWLVPCFYEPNLHNHQEFI